MERSVVMEKLSAEPLDVLVIGGGIVGAGVARDAALRGLRTGLVEQYDIAYGTSSRSSRLLHGGIRYLAQGRVNLVFEASVEKSIIHKIAPHVSDPLPFIFPTYKAKLWDTWALWKLFIGVNIYDVLCLGRNLGRSSLLLPGKVVDALPAINKKKLTGGVRYFDGLTNDARLVTDTLRSASNAGAMVLNYCRFVDAKKESSLWRCKVVDSISGKEAEITARCIVNATGPWTQDIDHSAVEIRPTKGVHLVVSRDRMPVPDAVVMIDGPRIMFAIPWGERVILGTTDTDYKGKPEDVRVEPEDIKSIIGVVNASFPEVKLTEDDVISAWAGLRPLLADPNGNPSDISRSHQIKMPEPGWWDVAGGKLTTYRLMGEQTVNKIQKYLHKPVSGCVTAKQPLLPVEQTKGISGIVPQEPSKELVKHYCLDEWAVHLDDVMVRRGGWTHYRTDADKLAQDVAGWMAEILGWDDQRKCEELQRYFDSMGLPGNEIVCRDVQAMRPNCL